MDLPHGSSFKGFEKDSGSLYTPNMISSGAIPSAALFETPRMVNRFMNVAYVAWSPALFLRTPFFEVLWLIGPTSSGNWHADYADLHCKAQQVPQLQSSQQATAMASMPSMPAYVPAPGLDWPPGMSTAQFPMFERWRASAFRSLEAMGGM